MSSANYQRLGEVVKARRQDRRFSVARAAALAGINHVTWAKIENGQPVRDLAYAGVDEALGYVPGSCRSVLHGGEPAIAADDRRMLLNDSSEPDSGLSIVVAGWSLLDDAAKDVIQRLAKQALADAERQAEQ